MPTYTYKIVLSREPTEEEFGLLADIGCDDAAFVSESGSSIAEFDRDRTTLIDALDSAIRDVESVGLRALRVLDGDLLTLADIADRIDRSRESIRRYAAGLRGAGDFPPPINPDRGGTAFYRWSEVAPWLRRYLDIDAPDSEEALVAVNLALQLRQFKDRFEGFSKTVDLIFSEGSGRTVAGRPELRVDRAFLEHSHPFVSLLRKSYEAGVAFEPYRVPVPPALNELIVACAQLAPESIGESLLITRQLVDALSAERHTDPEHILDELDRSTT